MYIGLLMALSYPLEIDTNPDYYRAMIEIKAFKTEPAEITKVEAVEAVKSAKQREFLNENPELKGVAGITIPDASITDQIRYGLGGAYDGTKNALLNSQVDDALHGRSDGLLKSFKGKPITGAEKMIPDESIQDIKLYMPVSFQMTDTFGYNQSTALGTEGAAALGVARAGGGVGDAAMAAIAEASAGISDTMGALVGNQGMGRLALARLGKMASGGIKGAAELAAQAVMNPNLRATFQQVNPRAFAFQFNFIPKNPAEAATVEEIIYNLRKAAYPLEQPEKTNVPLLFEYPDLFRITQKVKTANGYEVLVGSPITYCYLQSISVNINPIANNTFHADGYPIQTDLSLNFLEYRTFSKKDIKRGYGEVPANADAPDYDDEDIEFSGSSGPQGNPVNIPRIRGVTEVEEGISVI